MATKKPLQVRKDLLDILMHSAYAFGGIGANMMYTYDNSTKVPYCALGHCNYVLRDASRGYPPFPELFVNESTTLINDATVRRIRRRYESQGERTPLRVSFDEWWTELKRRYKVEFV